MWKVTKNQIPYITLEEVKVGACEIMNIEGARSPDDVIAEFNP